MDFKRKYLLLLFFAVAIFSLLFNEYNRRIIIENNPSNQLSNDRSLIFNSTIYSIDNDWYLPQIKNYLSGKGFTSNPNIPHYDVRRTPVYPMFYGFHYLIFGEANSYFFIRITQILLFALASIALLFATFNFTKNKTIALLSAILFGFNPVLVSYLYFTITEAVSPALVCFLLYFLSRCYIKNDKKNWIFVGIFFAIGSLCRTSIFFFIFSIFFAIIYINKKSIRNIIVSGLLFVVGASTLFVPHTVRNYILTNGDFILLEKYYGDPMEFGMPNIELRSWISCWTNPADYSSEVISTKMINSILVDSTQTKTEVVNSLINEIPERAILANNKTDITDAYNSLYDYYFIKLKSTDAEKLMYVEKICMEKMATLKADFIKNEPIQYYFVTPILVVKSIVFQSNASTIALLDNYQTSIIKKIVKTKLYLLNVLLFFTMFACILYVRKHLLIYGICLLFFLVNMIYITIVLKYFEARYLIPIFPCMYIVASIFLVEIYIKVKQKLHF